jgi:hypothetical protein
MSRLYFGYIANLTTDSLFSSSTVTDIGLSRDCLMQGFSICNTRTDNSLPVTV